MLKPQEGDVQPEADFQMKGPAKLYSPSLKKIKRNEKVTERLSLGLFGNLLQIFDWALQVGCMGSYRKFRLTLTLGSSQMRKITSLQIATQSHVPNGLFGVLPKCIIK